MDITAEAQDAMRIVQDWCVHKFATDAEIHSAFDEASCAVYEKRLGVRKRDDLGTRTAALSFAFKYWLDNFAWHKDVILTQEQEIELERKFELLKKS